MTRHRLPVTLLSAAAVAALAIPVATAGARAPHDRDHDGMPDRWEHAHGLRVKVDDARRDRDRDGLRNLAEFRAGTDPRDADTDNDGVRDGAEDAGTILSFTPGVPTAAGAPTPGVLAIKTFDGETLTGRVDERTEIECEDRAPAMPRSGGDDGARGGDDGDDDAVGEDQPEAPEMNDHPAPAPGQPATMPTPGHHDQGDDENENENEAGSCGPEALVAGARVEEAKLAVTGSGRVWREVDLAG